MSSCDYCGEKDITFKLKVKDEYGNQSVNNSETSVTVEKPCIVPMCSGEDGNPAIIYFDFTNSHFADSDILYTHELSISKDGAPYEMFSLPTGFGLDVIPGATIFTLLDGTNATVTGFYNDFQVEFDQPGRFQISITSNGENAAGYISSNTCLSNLILDNLAYTLTTTKQSSFEILQTGGSGYVDWGDSSVTTYDTLGGQLSLIHSYAAPGSYDVKVYSSAGSIAKLDIEGEDLTTIDISRLTNLNSFKVQNNPALTSIINPASSVASWNEYWAYNTGLTSWDGSGINTLGGNIAIYNTPATTFTFPTSSAAVIQLNLKDSTSAVGTLDLSGMTGLGGGIYLNSSTWTSWNMPVSSNTISRINFYNGTWTGALDLSTLTGLGGHLWGYTNPNLTGLTMPTTSQTFDSIYLYSTGLSGTLDLTTLNGGISPDFEVYSNSALTSILFPSSALPTGAFWIQQNNLTGTLDLSPLTGLGGNFRAQLNPNLTQVIFPTSSTAFNRFNLYQCNITGILDVSGLSGWGGTIECQTNPNMTGVNAPTSSTAINAFQFHACDLTGVQDFTTLTGMGGGLTFYSNPNLTGLLFGPSSLAITSFQCYTTNITGTLDLSMLTGFGGSVKITDNSLLTSITFPTSLTVITSLRLFNNDLTGTIDLSTLGQISTRILVYGNTNMTSLLYPAANTGAISEFDISNTGLTGTHDMSALQNLIGSVIVGSTPSMTGLTFYTTVSATFFDAGASGLTSLDLTPFNSLIVYRTDASTSLATFVAPTTTGTLTLVDITNCALSTYNIVAGQTFSSSATWSADNNAMAVANVNELLVNLDTLLGAGTGTLSLAGTNAAPDTTSGGFNGSAAKTSLQGKGWTVTTN